MSRELLEKAAKAAGIRLLKDPQGIWRNCTGADPLMNMFAMPSWNPLTDDGDALRLAVKLRLVPHPFAGSDADDLEFACCYEPRSKREFEERHNGDPYAATRLAIVRAAAAIGEKP